MATLQIKGMDDALYSALKKRAEMENRSVNQQVVTNLQDYLARPNVSARKATEEFLAICGTWEDDKTAEEMIKEIRQSRRSGRRFNKVYNFP